MLEQFERANQNPALVDVGATTVVVVGGGATGVEMAGALHELFSRVLADDFPALDVAGRARVILVEGGVGADDGLRRRPARLHARAAGAPRHRRAPGHRRSRA